MPQRNYDIILKSVFPQVKETPIFVHLQLIKNAVGKELRGHSLDSTALQDSRALSAPLDCKPLRFHKDVEKANYSLGLHFIEELLNSRSGTSYSK